MATMTTTGLDQFAFDFAELASIPDDVIKDVLEAEGEVIKRGQAHTASSMLRGPYYAGGIVSGIKLGKVHRNPGGASVYVTFNGTQHGTRIAEIAFINEFGKDSQPARPFIRTANEQYADEAVEAATKVYDQYLTRKGF